ncbi:MAG TPA: putative Na+/H+ antiporter [Opitutaceae bacterium]
MSFPLPLDQYPRVPAGGLWRELAVRVQTDRFNLFVTLLFLVAIVHTFLTPKFRAWARAAEARHARGHADRRQAYDDDGNPVAEVSFWGQILHFCGEVEAVFGLWTAVLFVTVLAVKGRAAALNYVGGKCDFTEPMFVMVIMALASTRPMLRFAERAMEFVAILGGATLGAWWMAILIIGPLFGSFISEPGAMTISALLLARHFYPYNPSPRLAYATIGLLFVNVSVGGTLTSFAAPPMVMAAGPWHWNSPFILIHLGWKAAVGIVVSTVLYYLIFRREFAELDRIHLARGRAQTQGGGAHIPIWIIVVQVLFMATIVALAHYPALFIGAFLFFLAFAQATSHYQKKLDLRPPLMVGLFLCGLVVFGGLQGWWLQPVLAHLGRVQLFLGSTFLTSFNDNAAITYLATLVPNLPLALKYAVVAGAVTGGGLTVIANAPNPAGQSILQRFFANGVSPLALMAAALLPTLIVGAAFMLL